MVKLRIKQQRFADEYLISGNIEQSAIAAGYSKKYARGRSHELLANVGVKNYIDTRLGEITQAAVNAGYNPKSAYKTGSENLRKPLIESYINRRMEELKKESIAEQDEVLQFLTSVVRGGASSTTLVGLGMGL